MVDSVPLTRVTWLIQTDVMLLFTLLSVVHSQSVMHRNQLHHANRSRTLLSEFYGELNQGRHFVSDPDVKRLHNPSNLESDTIQKINGRGKSN